jgi:PadR family transcriptional regulator AphA
LEQYSASEYCQAIVATLNTTSYAVLALLAVKSWTTYELAKQMERSLRSLWPRAESVIYGEPKKLVAHELATATKQYTGRRASTVYTITDEGRTALRQWLEEPGAGPTLEFEALLKVAFADQGDLESLRANLRAIRAHADAQRRYAAERTREYDETGGPFPHRLAVIALVARFHLEQAEMLGRWAEWAAAEVESWSGVTLETGARVPTDAVRLDQGGRGEARRRSGR